MKQMFTTTADIIQGLKIIWGKRCTQIEFAGITTAHMDHKVAQSVLDTVSVICNMPDAQRDLVFALYAEIAKKGKQEEFCEAIDLYENERYS